MIILNYSPWYCQPYPSGTDIDPRGAESVGLLQKKLSPAVNN